MKTRFVLTITAALSCLSVARGAPPTKEGNFYRFRLPDGNAEIEWISSSSFRMARSWTGPLPRTRPLQNDPVQVTQSNATTATRLKTKYVDVEIDTQTLAMKVKDKDGKLILTDAAPLERGSGGVTATRLAPASEEFWGLGFRPDKGFNARGSRLPLARSLLMSSLGYGLYHRGPASYQVDLAASRPDQVQIKSDDANRFEFFYYYGPTPKEILEEHLHVIGPISGWKASQLELIDGPRLPKDATPMPKLGICESVAALSNSAMSAVMLPAFDLAQHRSDSELSYRRAAQLGVVVPVFHDSAPNNDQIKKDAAFARKRLVPYLTTYYQEESDRGFSIVRPIPMQYPSDKDGNASTDQFLIGDEILVAPVCAEATRRSVYLPKGLWTDLRTNIEHKGRQRIEVEAPADRPPMFVRNGSIIPFAGVEPGAPMELHYFPSLGAEFFLFEPELEESSQFHAGPTADFWRLEAESKKDRIYEWVIHHKPRARSVVDGENHYQEVRERKLLKPGTWWHDATAGDLHVMVEGGAGQDRIVNISF